MGIEGLDTLNTLVNELDNDAYHLENLPSDSAYRAEIESVLKKYYQTLWSSRGDGSWGTDLYVTGRLRLSFTTIELQNTQSGFFYESSVDYAQFLADAYGLYNVPNEVIEEIAAVTEKYLNLKLSSNWT